MTLHRPWVLFACVFVYKGVRSSGIGSATAAARKRRSHSQVIGIRCIVQHGGDDFVPQNVARKMNLNKSVHLIILMMKKKNQQFKSIDQGYESDEEK